MTGVQTCALPILNEYSQLLKRKVGLLRQKSRNDKFGFTLAEVLITLGIIGIVAAMTMPSLISKYRIFANIQRLKSMYSLLSQSVKISEIDNGDISEWDFSSLSSKQIAEKYLIPYLKVVKTCETGDECFVENYLYSNKKEISSFKDYYSFVLNNGTLVGVRHAGYYNNINNVLIIVDVNGSQKPNISGYDLFFFYISTVNSGCWDTSINLKPGFYPSHAGCSIDMNRYASGPSCNTFYSGQACHSTCSKIMNN